MDKNKVTEFLKHRVLDRFALGADAASQEEVNSNIHKGIMIRGTNLWVLIFAIFIASLGLNTNSTAVIIGAMLISPLMGPIIGMGYSMGVYDFNLLKESLRNFLFMIVVSLITSAIFFTLPLISATQSELLARTQPTTYDILIALFGGLAGMVAQTRKDRTGTVIPGVAIATALMPPLCTVGYGLATFQFRFMLGALYLFTINSIFIALASFIVTRVMKFKMIGELDPLKIKKLKSAMIAGRYTKLYLKNNFHGNDKCAVLNTKYCAPAITVSSEDNHTNEEPTAPRCFTIKKFNSRPTNAPKHELYSSFLSCFMAKSTCMHIICSYPIISINGMMIRNGR